MQEILEIGNKPIKKDDEDEVRKKIGKVLGFPPSRRDNDENGYQPRGREAMFQKNVELFREKLNVIMEFKETRAKYFLIMSGNPDNCQTAIRAAQELFDKGYSTILTPGMKQIQFPVESKARGAVVGKNGENMMRIQDEYSVTIRLPPRDGNSDMVTLSGPTEGVKKAKRAIMQLVNTGISDITHPDSGIAEVMILNRRKAALIGPRGINIQRIQREYDCRVNVPRNEDGQKPNDKVMVTISGNKESIALAVIDVKESVAEPEPEQIPGFSKELTCEYDPWAED